jgi:endoglucanase
MAQTLRCYIRNFAGSAWFNVDWDGVINANSVVHVSACEVDYNNNQKRFNGDAPIWVKNVVPHGAGTATANSSVQKPVAGSTPSRSSWTTSGTGGVLFLLQADWGVPLQIAVDITVVENPTVTGTLTYGSDGSSAITPVSVEPSVPPQTQLRGVNITGLEMGYEWYDPAKGPVAGTQYPILDTRLIDYFKGKKVSVIRLLFQWEAVQPHLYDPIPNPAWIANYQKYWDNFIKIVNYASNTAGMQVIIEPWEANSSGGAGGGRWRGCEIGATKPFTSKYMSSFTVPIAAFADFWGKMATFFKGNPRVSYGLINEPNNQSTMTWFKAAQAAITAIRNTGSVQRIFVGGNGWSHAEAWTQNWYDTDSPQRSNEYGWLNANGTGQPLTDPQNNIAIEVHTYADTQSGGLDTSIVSATIMPERIKPIVDWVAPRGLKVYLGEIGFYAGAKTSGFTPANTWKNFITYFNANPNTLLCYTWWAAGDPSWWNDVAANGGGHFSVSPTNAANYTGDTVNMVMIQNDF